MRRTGKGGSQHEEMVDYFYYAQLVAQGENATADRYPPKKNNNTQTHKQNKTNYHRARVHLDDDDDG